VYRSHTFMLFIPASVHKCRHTSRVSQLCTASSRKRGDFARLASASIASPSKPYTLSFVSPGWKSVYVNTGVTRRMLGVPKCESDTILNVLFHQIAENVDFRVRFHGNRIQLRSGITGSVLFLLNEEHRVSPDIILSHPPFDI
jgi:hypothetical protein